MCFKHTLSKSKVREPHSMAEQDIEVACNVKHYHYRPRGTRTSPLVRKPVKIRSQPAPH